VGPPSVCFALRLHSLGHVGVSQKLSQARAVPTATDSAHCRGVRFLFLQKSSILAFMSELSIKLGKPIAFQVEPGAFSEMGVFDFFGDHAKAEPTQSFGDVF